MEWITTNLKNILIGTVCFLVILNFFDIGQGNLRWGLLFKSGELTDDADRGGDFGDPGRPAESATTPGNGE